MSAELFSYALALQPDWIEAAGTWVGGLGTVGALVYAIFAVRREAEHRRADIKRIASEQQSVQDAQARTVVLHDVAATLDGDGYDPPQNLIFNLQVGNYGTLPITSVIGKLTLRARPGEEAADNTPFAFVIPAGKSDVLTWHLEGHSKLSRRPWMSRWVRFEGGRDPGRLSGVDAAAGIL